MPIESQESAVNAGADVCAAGASRWLMHLSLELSEGVTLRNIHESSWVLTHRGNTFSFRLPSGVIATTFLKLSRKECRLFDLLPLLDEPAQTLSLTDQLQKLWRYGLLTQVLYLEGQAAAQLHASGETSIIPALIESSDLVLLSEYTCIYRRGQDLLLESTESSARVAVKHPQLLLAAGILANATSCEDLAQQVHLPKEIVMAFIASLLGIGAVRRCETSPSGRKDVCTWAFADRLLHARSRLGRHLGGYGATFHLREEMEEPPALAPQHKGQRIELEKPDLTQITSNDPPFTSVMESRRSVREYSREPMSLRQLSEFLYRTARVKECFSLDSSEFITRPYPSAGGLYEIEFYLVVNHCQGLKSSLYHYDGLTHVLDHICDPNQDTKQMLADAVLSGGSTNEPHVLIVLAARFLRVNWKYESIAYSLILKDVGVIYQTMYLVATAMGLAPCALGGGSSLSFCRATGSSYWEESSVGEFMLGRSRSIDAGPGLNEEQNS